jgi:hypothetical protein
VEKPHRLSRLLLPARQQHLLQLIADSPPVPTLQIKQRLQEGYKVDVDPPLSDGARYMREDMSLQGYRHLLAVGAPGCTSIAALHCVSAPHIMCDSFMPRKPLYLGRCVAVCYSFDSNTHPAATVDCVLLLTLRSWMFAASVDGLVEASRQSRVCAGAANDIACMIFRVLMEVRLEAAVLLESAMACTDVRIGFLTACQSAAWSLCKHVPVGFRRAHCDLRRAHCDFLVQLTELLCCMCRSMARGGTTRSTPRSSRR